MFKSVTNKRIVNYLFIIFLSFITIIGLNINLDKDLGFFESIQCNDVKYIFEFFACMFILSKVKFNNKRLNVICTVLAIILSGLHLVGYTINNYMQLIGIYYNFSCIVKSVFSFVGYFVVIYLLCYFIFRNLHFLNNETSNKFVESIKKISNKKFFVLTFILIFVAYIPYFLNYYPGVLSFDSVYQIQQGIGINELTTHHPLLHTMIIKVCIKLGLMIAGNYELGAGIYSILQMLFMSGVFAFVLTYMKKKNVNVIILICSLIFFMFYPVFGMYSITMWKDIPFALSFTLFLICVYEIITNKEKFLSSKKNNVLFVIVMLLLVFFRNNGIYILILMIPVIYIYAKKYYKRLTILFVIVIVCYKFVNGPLLEYFSIPKGSIREALSVPLQQLARVEANKSDMLTEDEYTEIHKFIKSNNIKSIYNPRLSDPIKEAFDDEYFKTNKLDFFKLWLQLFFKFPKEYVESLLCNSVGYWYPETVHTVITKNIYKFDYGIEIKNKPILNLEFVDYYADMVDRRNIPVVGMFFSIGANVWLVIILFAYNLYKKNYKSMIFYIPIFILWLTVIASPVHAEYRYIFGIFTSIPLIFLVSVKNEEK